MKKSFTILVFLAALACYSQSPLGALGTQVCGLTGEDNDNGGGKTSSRVGNGSGNYSMLIRIDLTGETPVSPCTLSLNQLVANVGATLFDYADGQFNTTVSTVKGVWENGSSDFNPEEGSACWNYRAYSATTPVNWVAGDAASKLSSVSKGQGGSHVNSTGVHLNTSVSGLACYVVLDNQLLTDLLGGFGGLLIYRAVGQTGEMKFSTGSMLFSWNPSGSAAEGAAAPARSRVLRISNTPNPFRSATLFSYSGAGKSADVQVFSLDGALVRTLSGTGGSILWNGADNRGIAAPAGTYVYRILDGNSQAVGRTLLLK